MILFRKSIISTNVMRGMTDCHSHILPDVDDGIESLKASFEALEYLEIIGVKRVVLTPHITTYYPLNSVDFITTRFKNLCSLYKGNIELVLGGEHMLDSDFENRLETGDILPFFNNNLLIEIASKYYPINFYQIIEKVQSKGYNVILAHPERYRYMEFSDYEILKQNNVKFQLNIMSLVGAYGEKAQLKSKKLLSDNFYDFTGSDIHNLHTFQKWINKKILSSNDIHNIDRIKTSMRDII